MGHRADRRDLAFWGAGGAACLSGIWQAASIQLRAAWMSENGENIAGMRLWLQLAHGNVTSLRDA